MTGIATFPKTFHSHGVGQIDPGELSGFVDLRDFVRATLDEEQARSLQFTIHAIQSQYDTYVQYTSAEAQDPSADFALNHVSHGNPFSRSADAVQGSGREDRKKRPQGTCPLDGRNTSMVVQLLQR